MRIKTFLGLGVMMVVLKAHALTITTPVSYSHSVNNPIVGTFDAHTSPADIPTVTQYLNNLLAMGASETDSEIVGGLTIDYKTSSVDYNGSYLAADGIRKDGDNTANMAELLSVAAGYDYVVVKYDGQNAGYVVWYLGGEAATLPEFSNDIWANNQGAGYGISGYTAYKKGDSVPDGGATAALLGLGVAGLAVIRRKR
jgi:hypothetical protein